MCSVNWSGFISDKRSIRYFPGTRLVTPWVWYNGFPQKLSGGRRPPLQGTGGFPGIEAAGQVRYIAEAGTTQDAGGNGTAIATLAVHDQQFVALALQFGYP